MTSKEILNELKALSNEQNRKGMTRFGINTKKAFGIPIPHLRNLAKHSGRDHRLALQLWKSGYHEARILASMIDEPSFVTAKQMDTWVKDFNSWDLCDQCCGNLFDKTTFAYRKAIEWSENDEEFIKRAGFSMMAALAVHNKQAEDSMFLSFFPLIKRESTDDRNFVRKAVNWALRQIGKRSIELNKKAIKAAIEISKNSSKTAKWISSDALKELRSASVQNRLRIERK
jgi:3-methyladenine DNA glycosylase AlkD